MSAGAEPVVVVIDAGTTGVRSRVIGADGTGGVAAYREFTQHYPQPGWVEHDAEEIWQSQLAAGREALAAAKVKAGDVAAIGITNQRETIVLWERDTLEPVHRAIVWQDRRSSARCQELKEQGHEALISEKTGLVLDPYFSATTTTAT